MNSFARKPPRWKDDNSIYFLTLCTFHHQKLLHENKIPEFLIEEIKFYSKKIQELIAYTIMPEHIHLLVTVEKVRTLSIFLRDFKKYTSVELKKIAKEEHVWQRGTMDHCIRITLENIDFDNHLKYIFVNSWNHLGIKPKDFPYHNFQDIVKKGWLEKDYFDFNAPEEFKRYE